MQIKNDQKWSKNVIVIVIVIVIAIVIVIIIVKKSGTKHLTIIRQYFQLTSKQCTK